mgnify:CR=1 FL=1
MLDCFAELIAIPSVSSTDPAFDMSNLPMVETLANWFGDLGMHTELMPVPGSAVEKFNLLARLGEGPDGLVLSGHTDTVPYNESIWSSDPFILTEREGRLYGLGTADMKSFFPLVIEALRSLELKSTDRPLVVLATADEESSMAGVRALQDSGMQPGRHALIGEPTGLVPVIKHKGILIEHIELTGQSGHSSDPSLGNNALEGMNRVMNRLLEWREELQSRFHDSSFRVPVPTLNLGAIRGGDNPNRICASCELAMDIRLLPDMAVDDIRKALHEKVAGAIVDTGLQLHFRGQHAGLDGMQTPADAEIVRIAEELSGEASSTVAFGTEGPYLNAMGMQTVILGPGDIDVAHQADEYVPMNRLQPMQKILEKMIQHFCLSS